jgi:hypothetical protein
VKGANFLQEVIEMKFDEYFGSAKGRGVLATAGADGRVDAAVYATPHVMDDETLAFIMADRLTHHNLKSNPHAAYLFMEDGEKYEGKRLFLTKIGEETDKKVLDSLRRRGYPELEGENEYLVSFRVDQVLPLVGSGEEREWLAEMA